MATKTPCSLGISPGQLNRFVEVYEQATVDDGYGGEVVTWTKKGELWVNGKLKSGTENKKDDKVAARATVVFRCNYLDASAINIQESDKLVFTDTGDEYNIRVIDDVEFLRMATDITCERGVAQ